MNLILDQFPRDGNSNPVSVLVATCHSRLTDRDVYTPLQSTSDGKLMVDTELEINANLTITNLDLKIASTDQTLGNRYIASDTNGYIFAHSLINDGIGNDISSSSFGGKTGMDVALITPVVVNVELDAINDQVQVYGFDGITITQIKTNVGGILETSSDITGGNGIQSILSGLSTIDAKLIGLCTTNLVPTSPTVQTFVFPIAYTFTQITPITSPVKVWQIKTRQSSDLYYRYSSVTPSVPFFNTVYMTLDAGSTLSEDTDISSTTLFISVAITNTTVELETWR